MRSRRTKADRCAAHPMASVSEATVRYRLTRLYRALGVRGRKAAVARAREIGLAAASRT